MTSVTCADLLPARPPASRRGRLGHCRADEPYNGWLPALLAAAPALPGLRVTICCRSAARPGLSGDDARPAANFLRLSLAAPLSAALLALHPEICLFTACNGEWRPLAPAPGSRSRWPATALAAPGAALNLGPLTGWPPARLRFALVTSDAALAGPLSAEVRWGAAHFREAAPSLAHQASLSSRCGRAAQAGSVHASTAVN